MAPKYGTIQPVIHIESVPVVANNIVYITSGDMGNLEAHALNAKNGNLIWKTPIGTSRSSSPAVTNGIVYIGSDDHTLYALNATNGKKIWNLSQDNRVSVI